MTTKLIALAVIAAAVAGLAEGAADVQPDTTFETDDTTAARLVAEGVAKPFEAAPAEGSAKTLEDPPAKAPKLVKVRLLIDGQHGRANDVKELPAAVAKALVKAGDADDEKDAVTYALALEQNQSKKA